MKYLLENTRAQFLELARLPAFFLPLVALPALFYLIVGAHTGPQATQVLFNYLAFTILGTVMFQFGVGIAATRNDPWSIYLLTLSATPRLRVFAQLVTAMLFGLIFVMPLLIIGALNGALFAAAAPQLGFGAAALIVGGVVHGCLGLALGYWLPARGALPIANLIYFPLSFVGGLFGSVELGAFQFLHSFSPTGAWADLIGAALTGRLELSAALVLACYLVICGLAAVFGYRKVEQTQYR